MYYNNKDVRIEERPIPAIGEEEILVKVEACGICGSDVLEWYRLKTAPRVLGHEMTGRIEKVGKKVKGYSVGERIFVTHHVPCNTCHYCLNGHETACDTLHSTNYDPGGFAEYVRIPAINIDRGIIRLCDEVSFEEGTFIEPLGCVLRAQRMANIKPASHILILGSGISGLLHIQTSRILGASRVYATDVNDYRLNEAKRFGADRVINALEEDVSLQLKKMNNNKLADIVIICTGAPSAINQALQCIDKGGKILFFAAPEPTINVSLSIAYIWRNDITMLTSYGASLTDLNMALEYIRNRQIDVKGMITHRLSLSETGYGFDLVANAMNSIKVIIEPNR